ncbi:hypothetical protein BCR32DRAFT_265465 [Anaeromyces robustus]|uniref:Metalloenzyme domain-containing protein n=1 Tax=Anaeromyces robustus TaxID=1754192 RepID=A0A1Y1XJS3_9FUNG|nr:hypothetical protein BCR32DRAFT_265465 [Anaeromyces robustus]|eukprot:ORX85716.1 hypothetical protein BCR32DRAFT_265465 [Anaeromyces robustus]
MTILRSYQASRLLPDKIINPEKAYLVQRNNEEKELCDKIYDTINDLDNNYISDDEGGEKTRAYRKRQNPIYIPSKLLTVTLSVLVVIYIIAQIIFFPFFIQSYNILNDSEGDGVKLLFPQYKVNNKNTYVGYFDRKVVYSFNKETRTIDTSESSNNIYLTWKTCLRDPGMNNVLKILYLIVLLFSVIAGVLYLSAINKHTVKSLIIQIILYISNLCIHFMLLSKPSGDRLIIQLTLSCFNLLILIPHLYLTNKVITARKRFGYYVRYPIIDLISRTFSVKFNDINMNINKNHNEDLKKNNNKNNKGKNTIDDNNNSNDNKDRDNKSVDNDDDINNENVNIISLEKKDNNKAILTEILKDIDNSLEIQAARKQMKQRVDKGHRLFSIVVIILVIILFGNFLLEFIKIMNTQGEFFPKTVSGGMTAERDRIQSIYKPIFNKYFRKKNKVEIILLDGLRYDKFIEHPTFKEITNDKKIMKDAKYYKINCSLPSMSLPNWLSIMTGSPPEIHGLLNNILAPETTYDSIFGRVISENGTFCGITGSTTFPALVKSQLSPLVGDGGVAPSFGPHGSNTNAYYADIERMKITKQALTGSIEFDLFLTHFSDIDIQGHAFGVSEKYNKDNTYYKACTAKGQLVKEILNIVDENTVVIIISDHGQVDAGGHGGTHQQNIDVPLMVYKKNSNFGSFKGTDYFPQMTWNNLDIAATVTGLLGYPAPAQNEGRIITTWIEGLVNSPNSKEYIKLLLRDLLLQKQIYAINLFKTMGMGPTEFPDILKRNPLNDNNTYTSEMYAKEIQEVIDIYKKVRQRYIFTHITRNAILDLIFIILAITFQIWIMERYTFTFPLNIFTSINKRSKNEVWYNELGDIVEKNRKAAFYTFIIIILQFILSLSVFFLYYYLKGYGIPDSTVLHHPKVIPEFLIALLCVAVILQIIFSRLFVLLFVIWNPQKKVYLQNKSLPRKIAIYIRMLYSNKKLEYTNVQMVYLMKEYAFLWSTIFICICLVLSSAYTFIIPNTFNIPFVIPFIWNLKFRVLSLQCISIPIIIGHLIGLNNWPPDSETSEDIHFFDGIYKMGAIKFMYTNMKVRDNICQKIYPISKNHSIIDKLLIKNSNNNSSSELLLGNKSETVITVNNESINKRLINRMKSTYSLLMNSEDYSKYFGDYYSVFNDNYIKYFKVRNLVDLVLRAKKYDTDKDKQTKQD